MKSSQYSIIEKIGSGSYGTVYKELDNVTSLYNLYHYYIDEEVAMKKFKV